MHNVQPLALHGVSPDCLTDIRQNLAAPRLVGKQEGGGSHLSDLLQNLHAALLEQIKSVMGNLQVTVTYITGLQPLMALSKCKAELDKFDLGPEHFKYPA